MFTFGGTGYGLWLMVPQFGTKCNDKQSAGRNVASPILRRCHVVGAGRGVGGRFDVLGLLYGRGRGLRLFDLRLLGPGLLGPGLLGPGLLGAGSRNSGPPDSRSLSPELLGLGLLGLGLFRSGLFRSGLFP